MTFQPVVERELRLAARGRGLYNNRFAVPLIFVLILVAQSSLNPAQSVLLLGPGFFQTMGIIALFLCFLEGVRQTADCLSSEKRGDTLGLLFLTDVNGNDVVIGKLAAASISSFHSLLALVPVLGFTLILGGVTAGEVVRLALALISLLGFSLSVGMWVSSRSRSASKAMGATIFLLASLTVVTEIFRSYALVCLSPLWSFFGENASSYSTRPAGFWISLLLTQFYSVGLLASAARRTSLFREDETPALPARRPLAIKAHRRVKDVKLLEQDPLAWLAGRGAGSAMLWLLIALAILLVAGFFYSLDKFVDFSPLFKFAAFFGGVVIIHLIIKILLAGVACRCLTEARANSTLEMLLCAPLRVEEILQGQAKAVRRVFLKPCLVLLALEMVGVFWFLRQIVGLPDHSGEMARGVGNIIMGWETVYVVFFLIDLQAVAWTGFWFGLCTKNESTATFKTAFYVILLPLASLAFYCLGPILLICWPLASYIWARLQLQEHFRALAGLRALSSGSLASWMPFHVPGLLENNPPD